MKAAAQRAAIVATALVFFPRASAAHSTMLAAQMIEARTQRKAPTVVELEL